jgi:hypothetical protein
MGFASLLLEQIEVADKDCDKMPCEMSAGMMMIPASASQVHSSHLLGAAQGRYCKRRLTDSLADLQSRAQNRYNSSQPTRWFIYRKMEAK